LIFSASLAEFCEHEMRSMENDGKYLEGAEFFEQGNTKPKITPERAWTILREYGLTVSQDQAMAILAFLQRLALIFLASTKIARQAQLAPS